MKKTTKFLALAVFMLAFAANTFAQVNGTAAALATIVTPITIAKVTDMNFGNVAVNATPGTVVMTPGAVRSVTGGCTLPFVVGTVTAGSFTVSGQPNYTYAITKPAVATTISDGAAHTMTVDTWITSPTPTGTLSAGGTQTLNIGATLNVGGSQTPGSYSSSNAGGTGDFTVTVNYN